MPVMFRQVTQWRVLPAARPVRFGLRLPVR
jgi:hypothetical protein